MKTAVLLAAGRGTRLKPHTDITPKPLLPVNGAPTLDLYFHGLQTAGITQVVLVTHHLAEQLERYAKQVQQRFEIDCATVHQAKLDGTASALEAAATVLNSNDQPFLRTSNTRDNASFLLMATDYLIAPEFIRDLVSFHQSHDSDLSVSLKRVPLEQLASRSSVRFDENNNIKEIVEKPERGKEPSQLGSNLAFVLPTDVLSYLPNVVASVRGEREIQSAINAYLASGHCGRGLIQETPSEWTPELMV